MRRSKLIAPSKLPGMWWGTLWWLSLRHPRPLGGSKHSPATYSVELSYLRLMVTVWTLYILPVNTLENQGSGHLKLWNPFSSTLLMYAESQNWNNLWRDIPKLLILLITMWPLSHIWQMWSFPPWNTFPLASGKHSLLVPLLALPAPYLNLCWFLLMSLTSKHWSAPGLSSPISSLCCTLSWHWISSTHIKHSHVYLHSAPTIWIPNSYVSVLFTTVSGVTL